MNEWKKMKAGLLYNSSSPDLEENHEFGMATCQEFNSISYRKPKKRQKVMEKLIPSSKGKGLYIFTPFYCEYGKNIQVGTGCFVNYNCVFLDVCPITLEDNVWLGANVTLATPSHPFLAEERLCKEYPDGFHDLEYGKPITIKKNCWICSSVTICGGVTVGENSIVAAGAVVTEDVPANSIVAGVPAKVIRKIDEKDRMDVWETYVKKEIPMSIRDKSKK